MREPCSPRAAAALRRIPLLLLLAPAALAAPAHEDARPGLDPSLRGEAIYARVLANRLESFVQSARLASGDRVGRIQETRLEIRFKDFRDADDRPVRGIVSKTIVRYTHPFDLRYAGYLVVQNHGRLNDQFVYLPARRQTVRVNLRGEAIFGTDFSFEDVLPRELEDAVYTRLPDAVLDGAAVYRVAAEPTASDDSEYSRFLFYVDPVHFVPLRTRYWDRAGVETKEQRVDRARIRVFDGVHVPMQVTMRHLQLESYTTFEVTEFVANPELPDEDFEVRRLEAH